MLAEVSGPGRGDEEVLALRDGVSACHLFVGALVILTDDAKAAEVLYVDWGLLSTSDLARGLDLAASCLNIIN